MTIWRYLNFQLFRLLSNLRRQTHSHRKDTIVSLFFSEQHQVDPRRLSAGMIRVIDKNNPNRLSQGRAFTSRARVQTRKVLD